MGRAVLLIAAARVLDISNAETDCVASQDRCEVSVVVGCLTVVVCIFGLCSCVLLVLVLVGCWVVWVVVYIVISYGVDVAVRFAINLDCCFKEWTGGESTPIGVAKPAPLVLFVVRLVFIVVRSVVVMLGTTWAVVSTTADDDERGVKVAMCSVGIASLRVLLVVLMCVFVVVSAGLDGGVRLRMGSVINSIVCSRVVV